MASLKKLLSDSVIYGLSSIVGRFLNYLLVPLYTYKIAASTGGYGVVTNLYAYTALLLVILTFGMETTYFYFVNKADTNDRQRAFSSALAMVGSVAGLFAAAVLLLGAPIASAMGYAAHPDYVRVMGCVVALDAVQAILFARLRQEGRAWKFATLKLAFIVGNIGLNLFIFLLAPTLADRPWMGWYNPAGQVGYIFKVNLLCTALVTLGFLRELRDFNPADLSLGLCRRMLRYAWPLLLLGIAGILNQVADKILFPYLMPGHEGEVQLGIYGACVKIAMIMALITQAFRYAYEPFVFGSQREKGSKESQAAVMKYFVMFTLLAFLAVVAYLDVLKYVIRHDYWEGLRAVPPVMLAEILMGVYFNLSFWYKLNGETWWGAVMSVVGCAVLVAVNVALVPRIGYMACAWGGVAGYGVCTLMSYFIGQRRNPVPYPLATIGGWVALAAVLFVLMQLLRPEPLWARLALNTLLLGVYLAAAAWSQRHMLKTAIAKLKHRKP